MLVGVGRGGEHLVPQRRAFLDLHRGQVGVRNHAPIGRAPRVDAHLRDRGRVGGGGGSNGDGGHAGVEGCGERARYDARGQGAGFAPSVCRTLATTFSTVNPKCLNSTGPGADSPNVSMPIDGRLGIVDGAHVLAPEIGDAGLDRDARRCRAAARTRDRRRPGGRTRSCTASTRRAPRRLPWRARRARPSRARLPSRWRSARPCPRCPRRNRRARSRRGRWPPPAPACARRNGTFCRVKSRHDGPCRCSSAAIQAYADSTVSHGRHRSMPGMRRRRRRARPTGAWARLRRGRSNRACTRRSSAASSARPCAARCARSRRT